MTQIVEIPPRGCCVLVYILRFESVFTSMDDSESECIYGYYHIHIVSCHIYVYIYAKPVKYNSLSILQVLIIHNDNDIQCYPKILHVIIVCEMTWKLRLDVQDRIHMMTSSKENRSVSLDLWEVNPLDTGGFLSQGPVTWSFDIFLDVPINKRLNKHRKCRLFETPWHSCDVDINHNQCD